VVGIRPTGNNAHAVAVDSSTGEIFLPYSSATSPPGCGACTDFPPTGGVLVFQGT
jgi:hypothetical protein